MSTQTFTSIASFTRRAVWLLALVSLSGCSFALDPSNCDTSGDCDQAGAVCLDGICVVLDPPDADLSDAGADPADASDADPDAPDAGAEDARVPTDARPVVNGDGPELAILVPLEGAEVPQASVEFIGTYESEVPLTSVTLTLVGGDTPPVEALVNDIQSRWSGSIDLPAPGTYDIDIVATDEAGGKALLWRRITWDDTRPTVAFSTPTADACVQGLPARICVDASDPGGLAPNGVTINGMIADAEGNLFCASVPLGEGMQTITTEARDPSGHVASDTLTVQVDQRPPVLTLLTPTAEGPVPAIDGRVEVEGLLTDEGCGISELRVNGTTVNLDETGGFSVDLPLDAGPQTLSLRAEDLVGNPVAFDLPVIVDGVPPVVEITAPEADMNLTAEPSIMLSARVTDGGSGIDRVTLNGMPIEGEPLPEGGVQIETEYPLGQGRNVIQLQAIDRAGLRSTANLEINADSVPPNVFIDDVVVVRGPLLTLTVTGRADDGPEGNEITEVTLNGLPVDFDAETGRWRIEGFEAFEDPITLTARATDALGNVSPPQVLVLDRDLTPPEIRLTDNALQLESCTRDASLDICAQVTDNENDVVEVLVNGVPKNLSPQGTFCTDFALDPGENIIAIQARNDVDLEGTLTLRVIRDQVAPEVIFDLPEGGFIDGTSGEVTISGRVEDVGCGITNRQIVFDGETLSLDEQNRFSTTLPVAIQGVGEGPNRLDWRVVDGAGNPAADRLRLVVDLDPPNLELTTPVADDTVALNVNRLDLLATVTDTWSGVGQITLDGVPVELEVPPGNQGVVNEATIRQSLTLFPGLNVFTLRLIDSLGISTEQQISVQVYLDDTPPSITIESPTPNTCISEDAPQLCAQVLEDNAPLGTVIAAGQALDPAMFDGNGRFCVPLQPVEGNQTFTVEAENVGGLNARASVSFEVDFSTPQVQIDEPDVENLTPTDAREGLVVSGVVTDQGCGLPEGAVLFLGHPERLEPIEVPLNPGGDFEITLDFQREGPVLMPYEISDNAGNVSLGQLSVWPDESPPDLNLIIPEANGASVGAGEVSLTFEIIDLAASPITEITINGEGVDLGPDAATGRVLVESIQPLSVGENRFTITATDQLNFTSANEITVHYDPSPGELEPRPNLLNPILLQEVERPDFSLFDAVAVSPNRLHVAAAYKFVEDAEYGRSRLGLWRRDTGAEVWRSAAMVWSEGCDFVPNRDVIICAHVDYPDLQAFSMLAFETENGTVIHDEPVRINLGATETPQIFDGFSARVSPDGQWAAAAASGPDGSQVMLFAIDFLGRPRFDESLRFEFLGNRAIDEVAFDATSEVLYATDFTGLAIHRFAIEDGVWTRSNSLPTGGQAVAGLDVDGEGRVIASGYFAQAVYVVTPDPEDFSQSAITTINVTGKGYDLCADRRPGAHWAWAVSQDAGETQAIDTATGEVLATGQITPHHTDGLSYACDPITGQPFAVSRGSLWTWAP
ncbi:MAG: hypothetical protein ACE366_10840 [Bradymonadia bacterium]